MSHADLSNLNRSNPARGVSDNVLGVWYRSQPKEWIENDTIVESLRGKRVVMSNKLVGKRLLFIDNCSGHNVSLPVLDVVKDPKMDLNNLAKNEKVLVQPDDLFVI